MKNITKMQLRDVNRPHDRIFLDVGDDFVFYTRLFRRRKIGHFGNEYLANDTDAFSRSVAAGGGGWFTWEGSPEKVSSIAHGIVSMGNKEIISSDHVEVLV